MISCVLVQFQCTLKCSLFISFYFHVITKWLTLCLRVKYTWKEFCRFLEYSFLFSALLTFSFLCFKTGCVKHNHCSDLCFTTTTHTETKGENLDVCITGQFYISNTESILIHNCMVQLSFDLFNGLSVNKSKLFEISLKLDISLKT